MAGLTADHPFDRRNVAGGNKPGTLLDIDADVVEWDVKLNLFSAFHGPRLAARQFVKEGKAGTVVNVASLNSIVPMFSGVGYDIPKAGVAMLVKQGALELGQYGIRVDAVSPGLVSTPLTKPLTEIEGVSEAFLSRIPQNRPAQPEEIANAVVFLAGDESSYVNGHNLVVDAGWAVTGYPDLRPFGVQEG
ncbi:MAG: SDR family NAD(P)-dependent oxidoreductase [Galactobacter sp.]